MKSRILSREGFAVSILTEVDQREIAIALNPEEILMRVKSEIATRITDELWPKIQSALRSTNETT